MPQVDARAAVQLAEQYFVSLYDPKTFKRVRVEEIEREFDGDWLWRITLGYDVEVEGDDNPFTILHTPAKYKREFKQFVISEKTGQVLAMRIRTP